jgi:hypothetical protein
VGKPVSLPNAKISVTVMIRNTDTELRWNRVLEVLDIKAMSQNFCLETYQQASSTPAM